MSTLPEIITTIPMFAFGGIQWFNNLETATFAALLSID